MDKREELINVYSTRHIDDLRQIRRLEEENKQLQTENDALRRAITALMPREESVKVYLLSDIMRRKPCKLKQEENIDDAIIVRFERG